MTLHARCDPPTQSNAAEPDDSHSSEPHRLEDRTTPATFGTAWPDARHLSLSFAPDGTTVAGAASTLTQLLGASNAPRGRPPRCGRSRPGRSPRQHRPARRRRRRAGVRRRRCAAGRRPLRRHPRRRPPARATDARARLAVRPDGRHPRRRRAPELAPSTSAPTATTCIRCCCTRPATSSASTTATTPPRRCSRVRRRPHRPRPPPTSPTCRRSTGRERPTATRARPTTTPSAGPRRCRCVSLASGNLGVAVDGRHHDGRRPRRVPRATRR